MPSTCVLQLAVTLLDSDPPIWRRLLVPGDTTLANFHHILQAAMGWTNSHLHWFEAEGRRWSDPSVGLDVEHDDEGGATLAQVLPAVGASLRYEYDFGDSWEHDVVVEKVFDPADAPRNAPACVAGERACPPEDVGGTPGYEEFLAAIADPGHEQHEDMVEWIGGTFDPEAFDQVAVNRALRRVARAARS